MALAPHLSVQSVAARLQPRPPARLFGLMDAAANDMLIDRLYAEPLAEFDLLLPGTPPDDVFYVAPFIVDLTGCDGLRDWLLSGWGRAWGIYVVAPMTLDALQRHLRQFVQAQLPDSTVAYFRFYDPRVFRTVMQTLEPEQVEAVFGPIANVYCESEDGGLLGFAARDGRLLQSTVG